MRPFLLPAAAAAALFAVPAPAEITALRWEYAGDCSAVKPHSARPQDTLTLVVGEPLELEVVGTGFAPGVGVETRLEAPAGVTARIVGAG